MYSLGFKTNLEENPITYYIDEESYDSNYLIITMIDELLRRKYNGITFYCHNLAGYDIVFILKALFDYNNDNKDTDTNPYIIDCILRKDSVIKVTISKKVESRLYKLVIVDSYAMLNSSLKDLCKSFNTSYEKGNFPYNFSTKENLFYIGNKPDISLYNISLEEYNNIGLENWSFKAETIKYLESDLNSLYEVLVKANKQIFNDFDINLMDSITISGLALKIFLKDFYNNNIPQINKASIYNDIRYSYYGGITEVYTPSNLDSNETLYYYDVNSLYPYAALNDMPGMNAVKINYYSSIPFDKSMFGFYNCIIETPLDSYFGLLPVRGSLGLKFPLGKYSGWYFSEELAFAQDNGYKITVLNGYHFDRVKDVFKSYIEKVYDMKKSSVNLVQRSLSKSLLNNLLGRFGISLDKPVTKIVSDEKLNEMFSLNKITSFKTINEDVNLVSYNPKLDSDIIKSFNLDITKVLSKHNDVEIQSLNISSVAISAAVNAYARVHMQRLKLDLLAKGGTLYYTDTDSIVTNIKLDNSIVDSKTLGKLKLEHEIDKAVFIAPKLYALVDKNGKEIIRAKGISKNSITYKDFISLLETKDNKAVNKTQSIKDWETGQVLIKEAMVNISSETNKKRKKY